MIYNLVLQHVPDVLESLLKSQTKWDKVSGEMDGVQILTILRDITHKHDSLVQSTLLYVKTFLEWTLTFQGKNESNTDYYTLFLSRIETIRSHGGGTRVPQRRLPETPVKTVRKAEHDSV